MDTRAKIRSVLRENYGNFESYLEHEYESKLTENLLSGSIENKKAWVTYNQVILELKHTIKDNLRVKELQYKLTDNSDPNEVCIQVMEGLKHKSPELERLYYKIRNFIK
jgi:hypothetical protein